MICYSARNKFQTVSYIFIKISIFVKFVTKGTGVSVVILLTMKLFKKLFGWIPGGVVTLIIFFSLFGYLGTRMGTANMLNTIMNTSHDLLLNTVFYLMAICVITGAIGKVFMEFGVVKLLEKLLRPLMKPLFNLPGVASLGAVLTFLSDNPAIISLSQDKRFAVYFKKYQFISLTNFGTAFGMGMLVIIFMIGQGYFVEPLVGLFGAVAGCIVSTRLMQRFVIKAYPSYKNEAAVDVADEASAEESDYKKPMFQRILDSLLDGGRSGVDVGLAIIPGVLIISTLVMLLTFGSSDTGFTGEAYQGVELLPWIGAKLSFLFEWLFGFVDPHLIAFPITALGAVGAALGLVPNFSAAGWIDGNAIAVFTAIGMCWSGYLSTHTAMLDTMGYRKLTSKAILAHTIGGFVAGIVAHWTYVLVSVLFLSSGAAEPATQLADDKVVTHEFVISSLEPVSVDAASGDVLFGKINVEVPQEGVIEVNFKNKTAAGRISVLGVDLADANGKGLSAAYNSTIADDSIGSIYTLSGVPAGNAVLGYYIRGGETATAPEGTLTLSYSSRLRITTGRLRALLDEAKEMAAAELPASGGIEREDAMYATLLGLLCDRYETLLASPSATVGELESACDEMCKVMGISVE